MPRIAFVARATDEAGNAVGGSSIQVRIYDDFAATVATVVTDDAAGGTTIAQPITPNAGTQTTLTVTTAAIDTTITVASTTGFAVGQLITIYDGTNTAYRFIRAILAGPARLTLEAAVGFIFLNTNTTVGNLDQIGIVGGYVTDTSYHYIQVKDVASGRLMPPTLIPSLIGTANVGVLEEGAGGGTRPTINFKGTAITAVDNAPSTRVDVTVGGDFSDQTSLRIGASAAATGILRLPNNSDIYARNQANSADLQMMRLDTSDQMVLGNVLLVKVGPGGGALAIGTTPATAGVIRLPNNQAIVARNAANTADISELYVDTNNILRVGDGTAVWLSQVASAVQIGTNPAAVGMIRLPASPTISNRNAANTADEQIWPHLTAENNLAADTAITPSNTYVDGPSVSLGIGTWFITGTVTFNADGQKSWTAKLWDGTTVESSTEYTKVTTGTGGDVGTMSLSGIVTLAATATWKISVATTSASGTGLYAAAPQNGAGNNASHIRAVRIG